MKKPILFIQLRTDESEKHEQKYVIKMAGLKKSDVHIINAFRNCYDLPSSEELDNYSGIITGASGQFNITDLSEEHKRKVEYLSSFYDEVIKRDFPTLAICFGHQLIAVLLGGEVKTDPAQSETGTVKITLTQEGEKSKLFQNIPSKFYAVLGHKDSIIKLPQKATLLAYSQKCKYEAYRIKKNIYSVQFHPELTREGLLWRLKKYPEYLQGKTISEIRKEFQPIPHARKVLSNFKKIIEEYNKINV